MTRLAQFCTVVGIGTIALGAGAMVVGMVSPKSTVDHARKVFSSKTLVALGSLKDELTRRFTDRQNVTFGMERVVRPDARLHEGPLAQKNPKVARDKDWRTTKDGKYEIFTEGHWLPYEVVKPRLSPENDREQSAVDAFDRERVSVAIYTVGQFGFDLGAKPDLGALRSQSAAEAFMYGGYSDIRGKGPAYLHQSAPTAPKVAELIDFARKAWKSHDTDYYAEGKDGWHYFAHRINASDESCVRCHGGQQGMKITDPTSVVNGKGDAVGLFVIALKKN